jgi:hypothetical protein
MTTVEEAILYLPPSVVPWNEELGRWRARVICSMSGDMVDERGRQLVDRRGRGQCDGPEAGGLQF